MTVKKYGTLLGLMAVAWTATVAYGASHLLNPLADDPVTSDSNARVAGVATEDSRSGSSPATRVDAMLAKGYSLLSSTDIAGATVEEWDISASFPSSADTKRSLLGSAELELEERGLQEKRATIDIQGAKCATACSWQQNVPKANVNDCPSAYGALYGTTGIFTVNPTRALSSTVANCSVWVVNRSQNAIIYDYWDAGGTGQWLTYYCLQQQSATVGVCLYNGQGIGTNVTNGVWTADRKSVV